MAFYSVSRLAVFLFFLFLSINLFAQDTGDSTDDGASDAITDDWGAASNSEPNEDDYLFANSGFSEAKDDEDFLDILKKNIFTNGFTFGASYTIGAFVAPGWKRMDVRKQDMHSEDNFSWWPGIVMNADVYFDIQLSDIFRIRQSITFNVLGTSFTISEFFFDYNPGQHFFIRAGKFNATWGQSRNYPVANLIGRVPASNEPFAPVYARVSIPVGIGGFELVASGRYMSFTTLETTGDRVGLGLKYNAAANNIDADIGIFYQKYMPLRAFVSFKSTLFGSWECYAEGLVVFRPDLITGTEIFSWDDVVFDSITLKDNFFFSGNIGFIQTFINDRLRVNAEVFYSGEKDSTVLVKQQQLLPGDEEEEAIVLSDSLNIALNIQYKTGIFFDLAIGLQFRWSLMHDEGMITPSITIAPAKHLRIGFAMPYITKPGSTKFSNPDDSKRQFSIMLMANLGGNYHFAHYN
jgi:hypothetical protein